VLRHRTTPAARMLPLPSAFSTTNIPTTVGIFRATRVIVGQGATFRSLTAERVYISSPGTSFYRPETAQTTSENSLSVGKHFKHHQKNYFVVRKHFKWRPEFL